MTPEDMHIRRMARDELNTLVRRLIRSRLAVLAPAKPRE